MIGPPVRLMRVLAWAAPLRLAVVLSRLAAAALPCAAAETPVDFADEVEPILRRACAACHGAEKQQGGLRLDLRASALGAGDSGQTAIVPGRSAESELIRRLRAPNKDERMPFEADPLSAADIAALTRWIDEGAAWPQDAAPVAAGRRELVVTEADRQHWSFRPLQSVTPPEVDDPVWSRNPIDRFLFAAQAAQQIRPNGPADRRTLIRRLSFDLIGLPPTRAEVEAFAADDDPAAYDRLVERLLGSVHYGERWGRHWLDVARYADSDGYESDADRPDAYPYRDFVIRAFNDDLPFVDFLRWQLAGDEYEPDNPLAMAATGFLAAAPTEVLMVPMAEEKLRLRYAELDDMATTTSLAFLGLTLGCARCHDHKFDPIPTRDYYRLQCAFTTARREHVPLAPRAEAQMWRAAQTDYQARRKQAKQQLDDWLAAHQQPHRERLRNAKIDALAISPEDRQRLRDGDSSASGKKLLEQHQRAIEPTDDDYRAALSADERGQWDALKDALARVEKSPPPHLATALAVVDQRSEPEPTWLLERGDFHRQQEPVGLGFFTVLTSSRTPDDYWRTAREHPATQQSTGQRRALAEWLTDVEHGAGPLAVRVFVNRVWQHHFGEGLARTVNDLGTRGERPAHPELLEWLARDFVDAGFRVKALHRLIVTSAAYQQASTFDPVRAAVDPENRLLWRRRPQRLEAEALRDAILAASGALNSTPYGPAFKPPIPPEAMLARNTKDPYPTNLVDSPATLRRTVYLFHKRVVQYPLLQAFDAPDASVSCGRRNMTTIAPQALALLNDRFLRDRAVDFARSLLEEDDGDDDEDDAAADNHNADGDGDDDDDEDRNDAAPRRWIEALFWRSLARGPSDAELAASAAFLERRMQGRRQRDAQAAPEDIRRRALADFCQVLFSMNEFMYVD